jgi:hypothetical protein
VIFVIIVVPLCLAIGVAAPFIADNVDQSEGAARRRRLPRAEPFGIETQESGSTR